MRSTLPRCWAWAAAWAALVAGLAVAVRAEVPPAASRTPASTRAPVPLPAKAQARAAPNVGAVDVTAFGARGDGVADDTAAFVRAAATGRDLHVPRPPRFYRLTATVPLRASIRGEGLPELRMDGATGEECFSMLSVIGYAGPGLVISGLRLDGGWDGAAGGGEWSHNVLVKGSRNVTIERNVLDRPRGDNVLVGGENDPRPSENVVIQDNQLLGPRRCNVAIISARGVKIRRNVVRKANDYVSAVDLEPNPTPDDAVWDVEISDNRFDAPNAPAVMLYHFDHGYPPNGLAGGHVRISGNTGVAAQPFVKVGKWGEVTRAGGP